MVTEAMKLKDAYSLEEINTHHQLEISFLIDDRKEIEMLLNCIGLTNKPYI